MAVPRWLLDKRHSICASCERAKTCKAKYEILSASPPCPINKLPSLDNEIAERAWPSGAARVSGCCDSAVNYGD